MADLVEICFSRPLQAESMFCCKLIFPRVRTYMSERFSMQYPSPDTVPQQLLQANFVARIRSDIECGIPYV